MISTHELRKSYGRTPAVHAVSFDRQPGTIIGFLGPNRAGKTPSEASRTCGPHRA